MALPLERGHGRCTGLVAVGPSGAGPRPSAGTSVVDPSILCSATSALLSGDGMASPRVPALQPNNRLQRVEGSATLRLGGVRLFRHLTLVPDSDWLGQFPKVLQGEQHGAGAGTHCRGMSGANKYRQPSGSEAGSGGEPGRRIHGSARRQHRQRGAAINTARSRCVSCGGAVGGVRLRADVRIGARTRRTPT